MPTMPATDPAADSCGPAARGSRRVPQEAGLWAALMVPVMMWRASASGLRVGKRQRTRRQLTRSMTTYFKREIDRASSPKSPGHSCDRNQCSPALTASALGTVGIAAEETRRRCQRAACESSAPSDFSSAIVSSFLSRARIAASSCVRPALFVMFRFAPCCTRKRMIDGDP